MEIDDDNDSLIRRHSECLSWSRVPIRGGIVPPRRSGAASVVVQGKLYVYGGYGGGTGRLDDFYAYSFDQGTWEEVKVQGTAKPGRRENNGVVISDSSKSIYLFGGYNGTSWLNDLWEFDIESHRWTCIQESTDFPGPGEAHAHGQVPSRRFGYVSVVHAGKLVLFGGFDGTRWLNDMFVFDFATRTWTEVVAHGLLPSVRSCPAWAKDRTHVYIHGGYDGVDRKADFFACDLNTYTWTKMPCYGTPPSPRYFHSCCLYGNKMYCYGGYSGHERLADMFAYDFETHHWSQIDCTVGDAPSGRSSLVAQVYDNCLYVFGGYNGSNVLNDFYKFRLFKPIGVPPASLVQDFARLINDPTLADCSFLVEGQQVYAHRAILAARSEYFRVMLCGGMRESTGAPIEIADVSHAVFLKVMEFLYTDTVDELNVESGVYLLIASEHFLLDRLKCICEDSVRRGIHSDNVTSILVASQRHNATGLREIALQYILDNLDHPTIQACLGELRSEPDLLVEIIKRRTLTPHADGAAGRSSADPFGAEWGAQR